MQQQHINVICFQAPKALFYRTENVLLGEVIQARANAALRLDDDVLSKSRVPRENLSK